MVTSSLEEIKLGREAGEGAVKQSSQGNSPAAQLAPSPEASQLLFPHAGSTVPPEVPHSFLFQAGQSFRMMVTSLDTSRP